MKRGNYCIWDRSSGPGFYEGRANICVMQDLTVICVLFINIKSPNKDLNIKFQALKGHSYEIVKGAEYRELPFMTIICCLRWRIKRFWLVAQ
jgi:hypothetical protein